MPIVSAVVYTRPDSGQAVACSIGRDPRVTIGSSLGDRFALVTDTCNRAEDMALWRTVEQHDGVLRIELIVAHFEDLHQEAS